MIQNTHIVRANIERLLCKMKLSGFEPEDLIIIMLVDLPEVEIEATTCDRILDKLDTVPGCPAEYEKLLREMVASGRTERGKVRLFSAVHGASPQSLLFTYTPDETVN